MSSARKVCRDLDSLNFNHVAYITFLCINLRDRNCLKLGVPAWQNRNVFTRSSRDHRFKSHQCHRRPQPGVQQGKTDRGTFPLPITATPANHRRLWAQACNLGWIVLSSKYVTPWFLIDSATESIWTLYRIINVCLLNSIPWGSSYCSFTSFLLTNTNPSAFRRDKIIENCQYLLSHCNLEQPLIYLFLDLG